MSHLLRYIVYMCGVSACHIYLIFIMKFILVYTKFDNFFFPRRAHHRYPHGLV